MMATLMSQPDEFDPIVFVRGAVEELRRELLDFSKRNKLLSFKHPLQHFVDFSAPNDISSKHRGLSSDIAVSTERAG